jgi:glycolate oxidase iron-sulfur subunit
MQTNFSADFLATSSGSRANEILRSCVHCGFCNATCPTYQITGDELDGPRGRIYLIKELLETQTNVARATRHLDRCLTCRACESVCPSGVAYGELAEIARVHIGPKRRGLSGWIRILLRWMIPNPVRLRTLSRLGSAFRWVLPRRLAKQVPAQVGAPIQATDTTHARKVLLLNGCAQQVATADTNIHLISLLGKHDIGVVSVADEQCCGSLDLHLGAEDSALSTVRANVDALSRHLDDVEAIVSSASGCGVTIKDYGRLLSSDAEYAERAQRIAAKTVDVSEYLATAELHFAKHDDVQKVAWHPPCTLQHGQSITGLVEVLLEKAGYELTRVVDAHLCCGSAGTYSVLQPELAEELKQQKLGALLDGAPDVVATANVGCQTHLSYGCKVPVKHWIELLN